MFAYITRRILYAIPILIGVNLITFTLFFFVNSPDDMARMHLGNKRVTGQKHDHVAIPYGEPHSVRFSQDPHRRSRLDTDRDRLFELRRRRRRRRTASTPGQG